MDLDGWINYCALGPLTLQLLASALPREENSVFCHRLRNIESVDTAGSSACWDPSAESGRQQSWQTAVVVDSSRGR
jgi:hypothetical protein